jgi:hypothetical protein
MWHQEINKLYVYLYDVPGGAWRRWIATTGQLVKGLRPEGRDDPYPAAKSILRALQDYALAILRHDKTPAELRRPKLRPVQQKIWNIMGLLPLPS